MLSVRYYLYHTCLDLNPRFVCDNDTVRINAYARAMGLFAGPIDGFCVLSREALYTIAFNEGPLEESTSDPRSVGLGQGPENLTFDWDISS